MPRHSRQATVLFLVVFGLLAGPVILWPRSFSLLSFVGNMLYGFLAVALATELTETILALLWSRCSLPRQTGVPPRSTTAVVMTVCDDWSERHLSGLGLLARSGYDVFLLDDSLIPARVPPELAGVVVPIRRDTRKGAKAGNLNHWLRLHGHGYRAMIILDADSTMSVEAADALLLSALHPNNQDIALFQAKIEPDAERHSLLATILGVVARPRMRVMERVHMPLGLLLSFGHNQLLRIAPLNALGGFDETLSNEDTAISLALTARGWRVGLVDVWTQDKDPTTISAYSRRTVRWAKQTLEIFRRDWIATPLRLKLLLCRHLLMNTLPIVTTSLLALSLWTGPRDPRESSAFLSASLRFAPGYRFYGVMMGTLLTVALVLFALRIALARFEAVSWKNLVLSWVLGTSFLPLLVLPLAGSTLRMLIGGRVHFVSTNSRVALFDDALLRRRLLHAASLLAVLLVVMTGAITHPGSLLLGLNWLWCALLFLSPVSLLILAFDSGDGR